MPGVEIPQTFGSLIVRPERVHGLRTVCVDNTMELRAVMAGRDSELLLLSVSLQSHPHRWNSCLTYDREVMNDWWLQRVDAEFEFWQERERIVSELGLEPDSLLRDIIERFQSEADHGPSSIIGRW